MMDIWWRPCILLKVRIRLSREVAGGIHIYNHVCVNVNETRSQEVRHGTTQQGTKAQGIDRAADDERNVCPEKPAIEFRNRRGIARRARGDVVVRFHRHVRHRVKEVTHMPALPHTIITNINHLLINLHDSVPQEIKSWADAREFESVLA